jgi:hypothetical protein
VHEAFGGEAGKLTPQEARNLGLIDFQNVGGASLRESPHTNSLSYPLYREARQSALWIISHDTLRAIALKRSTAKAG